MKIIFIKDKDDRYTAIDLDFPNAVSQGETKKEAKINLLNITADLIEILKR